MPQGLDNFIGAVGDAIKTAPTFYEDALQPTVQETGKILALIPQTIEAALLPLRQWNIEREYKFAETKKLLEHKLQNVEPEKIVTPEAYVAVPAIQAISYSMDSEELRNLYANLLAKAMNSDTKDSVHPSFIEIIKQMSPIDSLIFKIIMEREENPILNLCYGNDMMTESLLLVSNITDIHITSGEIISVSVDNLIKQGIISIPFDEYYDDEHYYDKILNSQFYLDKYKSYPKNRDGLKLMPDFKMIRKTNLGLEFYNTCVKGF